MVGISYFVLATLLAVEAVAAPTPSENNARFSVPLTFSSSHRARELAKRDGQLQDRSWLLREAVRNDIRYNEGNGLQTREFEAAVQKRQSQSAQLQDNNQDASYSALVDIGTPAQSLPLILDTGSSDIWVAGVTCAGCKGTTFAPEKSSTYKAGTQPFSVKYGSGSAAGDLVQDTMSLGGYSVPSQTFAVVNNVTTNLISQGISGIMGLSFTSLASSKATPWWVNSINSWPEKLFAFHLKRYRNDPTANAAEPDGGVVNFGHLDQSLYTGAITYIPVPAGSQYWQIPISSLSVQGTNINLNSATAAAVDTGTTLIGGPEDIITSIYNAIPNSRRMTGSYANYFEYPCNTDVSFKLAFGGFTLEVGNDDFNLGQYSDDASYCTGAVFVQNLSSTSVRWIVGATALKNSYTVFQSEPQQVGFAALATPGSNTTSASASTSVAAPSNSASAKASGVAGGNAASSSSESKAGAAANFGPNFLLGGLFMFLAILL